MASEQERLPIQVDSFTRVDLGYRRVPNIEAFRLALGAFRPGTHGVAFPLPRGTHVVNASVSAGGGGDPVLVETVSVELAGGDLCRVVFRIRSDSPREFGCYATGFRAFGDPEAVPGHE